MLYFSWRKEASSTDVGIKHIWQCLYFSSQNNTGKNYCLYLIWYVTCNHNAFFIGEAWLNNREKECSMKIDLCLIPDFQFPACLFSKTTVN